MRAVGQILGRHSRATACVLFLLALLAACAPSRDGRLKSIDSANPGPRPSLFPRSELLNSWFLVETQEQRFSTEFTLTNGSSVLKIEAIPGLGVDGARQLTEDGIMGVHALYANALSPYPGDISNLVVAEARFRPVAVSTNANGLERRYLLLFANARLGYGATSADTVRYRSSVGWFFCERKDVLYRIRCFLPLNASTSELESFILGPICP